jgi:hypothetical protein
MRNKLSVAILLLLLSLTASSVSGQVASQTDEKEKAANEAEKRKELEKKTLGLLDATISDALGLKLSANRSYVLMSAAELLWSHDQKRARNLFWEAFENLNLANVQPVDDSSISKDKAAKDTDKPTAAKGPTKEQTQILSQYYDALAGRREFLRRVARRDAQLALDMVRASRIPVPLQIAAMPRIFNETDLEEEIAEEAAASDPKRALQIARETLAKGLTIQIANLAFRLNQKDEEAATELASDIIAKLRTEDFSKNIVAPLLAQELLEASRVKGTILVAEVSPNTSPRLLKLNDDQRQDIVGMMVTAALSPSERGNVLRNIHWVMQEVEQYAPDRAAQVKSKLAAFNGTLNKEQRDWQTYEALFEKATPEEMIKAADKLGDEQRESMYREAVIKAVGGGRYDATREFIKNQIEDDGRRKQLLESLDEQRMYQATSEGKPEEMQKLLGLIESKELRAMLMAELAIGLEKKDEHEKAVALLDEARALVKVNLTNEKQSNALMSIMLAYALVDPPRAFAMIEPIVDRTNDEISKLMLVDRVVKTGAVKDGEIMLNQPQMPLGYLMERYGRGVVALAKADFDRTKALADRFQRNELKILARLLLAQALLRNAEPTPQAR